MKQFVTDLKVSAAVEHVECLISLDVIVRPRLEAGLAVLLHHLEGLIGVRAGDLDDHLVRLGIEISLARLECLPLAVMVASLSIRFRSN